MTWPVSGYKTIRTPMIEEEERLLIQGDLDSNKSSLERNKLGQYATPTILAREVVAYGLG